MQTSVHCVGLSSSWNPKNSLSLIITLPRHPGFVSKTFLRIFEYVFNLFFLLHSDFSLFSGISKVWQKVISDIKNNITAKFQGNFFEVINLLFHPVYIFFLCKCTFTTILVLITKTGTSFNILIVCLSFDDANSLFPLYNLLNNIKLFFTRKRPIRLNDDMCTIK